MNNYTTIAGDMWDSIAFKTTGNEFNMDTIIKANLQYRDVYIFPAGVVLSIPTIPIKNNPSLPPWKRGV